MGVVVGTPAVHEEPHRHKNSPWYHHWHSEFWSSHVVVPFLEFAIDSVIDGCTNLCAQEEANTKRDVVEAADSNGFTVHSLPNHWESGQDEIHKSIEVSPESRQ